MIKNCTDLAYQPTALIREDIDARTLGPAGIDRKLVKVGQIVPQDGQCGGWLYLSSQDCGIRWEVTTSQDRVNVPTYRKTGPASWSRVWLSSGCQINAQLYFLPPFSIDPDTGLVSQVPAEPEARLRWWYYPYSVNEAFETMEFSYGPNGWDDFPEVPAGATVPLGYPPRLTRYLYLQATGRFVVTLGRTFDTYAVIGGDNQAGFAVSPWTSVLFTNTSDAPVSLLGTWSNVAGSILNP